MSGYEIDVLKNEIRKILKANTKFLPYRDVIILIVHIALEHSSRQKMTWEQVLENLFNRQYALFLEELESATVTEERLDEIRNLMHCYLFACMLLKECFGTTTGYELIDELKKRCAMF